MITYSRISKVQRFQKKDLNICNTGENNWAYNNQQKSYHGRVPGNAKEILNCRKMREVGMEEVWVRKSVDDKTCGLDTVIGNLGQGDRVWHLRTLFLGWQAGSRHSRYVKKRDVGAIVWKKLQWLLQVSTTVVYGSSDWLRRQEQMEMGP